MNRNQVGTWKKHHGWPREHKAEEMDLDLDDSQGVRYCVVCDYEAEDMSDRMGTLGVSMRIRNQLIILEGSLNELSMIENMLKL